MLKTLTSNCNKPLSVKTECDFMPTNNNDNRWKNWTRTDSNTWIQYLDDDIWTKHKRYRWDVSSRSIGSAATPKSHSRSVSSSETEMHDATKPSQGGPLHVRWVYSWCYWCGGRHMMLGSGIDRSVPMEGWTLSFLTVLVMAAGFAIKNFVLEWNPFRIHREKDHVKIVFTWKKWVCLV